MSKSIKDDDMEYYYSIEVSTLLGLTTPDATPQAVAENFLDWLDAACGKGSLADRAGQLVQCAPHSFKFMRRPEHDGKA